MRAQILRFCPENAVTDLDRQHSKPGSTRADQDCAQLLSACYFVHRSDPKSGPGDPAPGLELGILVKPHCSF